MEELILELIGLVRDTAPALWEIALRQVLSVTVTNMLSIGVFVVLSIICFLVAWKLFQRGKSLDSDATVAGVGLCVIGGVLIFISLAMFRTCLLYIMNPEYYAIVQLLDLVR